MVEAGSADTSVPVAARMREACQSCILNVVIIDKSLRRQFAMGGIILKVESED